METITTTKTIPTGQSYSSPQIQYGWKCPTCGAVMAPWQSVCVNCLGSNKITVGDYPYKEWWEGSPTWDYTKITCNDISVATSKDKGASTVTAYNNNNPTTKTLSPQENLKKAIKNAGLNI